MTPTVFCSLSFSSSYFSETRFLIYSLFIRFSCARRSDLRFKFKRLCCPYRFIFSPKEDLILLALASSFGIHSAPSISHQVPLRHVNRMVHLHKLLRAEKKHTQKISFLLEMKSSPKGYNNKRCFARIVEEKTKAKKQRSFCTMRPLTSSRNLKFTTRKNKMRKKQDALGAHKSGPIVMFAVRRF